MPRRSGAITAGSGVWRKVAEDVRINIFGRGVERSGGAIGRIASLASTSVSVEFIDSGLRSGDGAAWSSIYAG